MIARYWDFWYSWNFDQRDIRVVEFQKEDNPHEKSNNACSFVSFANNFF